MDLSTLILTCSLYTNSAIVNAIIQTSSQGDPLAISTAEENNPNQITVHKFKNQTQALQFAQTSLAKHQDFALGIMQIPSSWITRDQLNMETLLRPCGNIAIATKIIGNALEQCIATNREACALSTYKTTDPQRGLAYAAQIISYANEHPLSKVSKPILSSPASLPEKNDTSIND